MSTHAHHFCMRNTLAGLGQIVLADIFIEIFEKMLLLMCEVVLCDTAISKRKERAAFEAIHIPSVNY